MLKQLISMFINGSKILLKLIINKILAAKIIADTYPSCKICSSEIPIVRWPNSNLYYEGDAV